MKYSISVFTLTCGRLNRVKIRFEPMDFEFAQKGASQPSRVDLVDRSNGNSRSAQVSFFPPNACARFDGLMDFDFFDAALESHDFLTDSEH